MLTKYNLIHVPPGGVDQLLNGRRVRIDPNLTDQQADQLKALGCRFLQLIEPIAPTPQTAELSAESHGISPENKTSGDANQRRRAIANQAKRSANGRFVKKQ